jgi:flagellar protein FlgJ
MPMGLFDMQEQPPQTFGERLRAGMRSGSLIDSLALAANSLRDRPDQNIAQIVQGRQERRDEKATANRTAAWLASQGRDDLAQGVIGGWLDARTAVATAMTPAPQAEVREVGGKLVSVNPDGTVNELYAPEAQPEFRTLTADEATALGLAPGAYQIGADGKISTIGGGGTTINMPGGGGEFEEAFAKLDAASLDSVSVAGMNAQRNIGRIDQLGEALASSPSGAEGALKLAAGEFGINTEGLDNLQLAESLINSLVPEQRPPGSGAMSDADLDMFKKSLPRIINQPGGNLAIIQTMRAIAEYDAAGADIVQLLRSGEIDRSEAFKRLRSRPNPLEGLRVPAGGDTAGGATTTAPAGGVRTFNPATGKLE